MSKVSIHLRDVAVDFPIFNASSISLKNRAISVLTGGMIERKHSGVVMVRGLQGINLDIASGERVGLIGHNGAGKSTLLRVLSGIYEPTQGTAQIHGQCTSLINIGLGIDPEASGRHNIYLRGLMMGLKPHEIKRMSEEIIEFTNLGDFIDLPYRTYSTGMQLRLAFAVSTAVKPQILIMDEWLSTGDEGFRERADERLRRVVGDAQIMILASHSRDLLMTNCTRIVWLEHGQIKMDGLPEVVLPAYFGNSST